MVYCKAAQLESEKERGWFKNVKRGWRSEDGNDCWGAGRM